jgi:hypothetical protein
MRQVPLTWNTVPPLWRANCSSASLLSAVAGQVFLARDQGRNDGAAIDVAQLAQARHQHAQVVRLGQVVGHDARRRQRVGLRMPTVPLLTGRHWVADAEKPEKRCSGSPGLSTDSGITLNSTSARPALCVFGAPGRRPGRRPPSAARAAAAATAAPICASRSGLRTSSLSESAPSA